MRKLYSLLSMVLSVVSLVSCNVAVTDSNQTKSMFMEKELVLGNERLITELCGTDGETVFVEEYSNLMKVYNNINQFNFYDVGKMISYHAEIKYDGDIKTDVNMNIFYHSDFSLYEYEITRNDFADVAYISEYSYSHPIDGEYVTSGCVIMPVFAEKKYSLYSFLNGQAFSGYEYDGKETKTFSSSSFPSVPIDGTELLEMYMLGDDLRRMLFDQRKLFFEYDSIKINENTYELNKYVKSKIEIYDNYVIFEQKNSFFGINKAVTLYNFHNFKNALDNVYFATVRAYYNVNSNEVEYVTIVGKYYSIELEKVVELNLEAYVHDSNESLYSEKINTLQEYVWINSDNVFLT